MVEYTKEDLKVLKERADKLDIKYSPNISYEKLQDRINEKLNDKNTETENKNEEPVIKKEHPTVMAKKRANELIRVIVTCKNPNKKEWQGEIVSAGNANIGFVKKFVLFNEPYHIPKIIYNVLKEREYQRVYTKKVDGREVIKNKNVKEFDIEILPPLSEKELKELKQRQLAKGIMGEDE